MKSKFQHRHYVAIAKVIADAEMDNDTRAALIRDMSDMFKSDNYSFQRDRFYNAAKGNPNGRDKPR